MLKLKPVLGLKSPAAIAHDGQCEEILIDPAIWWLFSPQERRFIIEHELAHCEHNVYDEMSADQIGFQEFIEDGGNPYAAITALKRLGNSPAINQRIETLIENNMWHTRQPYDHHLSTGQLSYFGPDEAWGHSNDTGGRNKWDADDWNNLIGEVGGIVAAILGGNRNTYPGGYYPPQQPKNDTWLYIIGGLILVLLVLVLIQKR